MGEKISKSADAADEVKTETESAESEKKNKFYDKILKVEKRILKL